MINDLFRFKMKAMKVMIFESKIQAAQFTSQQIFNHIKSNPEEAIGLATGATMIPVYEEFVKLAQAEPIPLKNKYFLLDEYLGMNSLHPESFRNYIRRYFQDPLHLQDDQFIAPYEGDFSSVEESILHYETQLKSSHGISLQLLGIGQNGHIGFNEPGSKIDSTVRRVFLTESTRLANKAQFPHEEVPREAVTTGLSNIFKSKKILLLATGKSKALAVEKLQDKMWDSDWPATSLVHHHDFLLVLDKEAAERIR